MATATHELGETRVYGEICRVDDEQQMVWGYASTSALAGDGQTIAISALEDALDEYMRFANIREMHLPSAVGVTREASVDEKGMYVGVHVVDPIAWLKVKTKVYKGFSIKGPVTKRDPLQRSHVLGLAIHEISLVDRPSDPDAVFDVWRMAGGNPDQPQPEEPAAAELEDTMSRARKADAPPAPEAVAEDTVERAEGQEQAATDETPAAEAASAEAEPVVEAAEDQPGDVERAVQAAEANMARLDEVLGAPETTAASIDVNTLPGAELRRSLSMVNRLGYVLSELTYIIFDADFEREIEGDESTVPAQLRDGLRTLATAYKAMSAEEVDELLKGANVEVAVVRSLVELSVAADVIERGENCVDDETAGRLQQVFDTFIARGWAPPVLAERDDLARQIEVVTGDRDTLMRTVEGYNVRFDELGSRIDALSRAAAPAKTVGTLTRAVEKAEDAAGQAIERAERTELSDEEVRRALDALPEEERAMVLMRAAVTRPIPIR